MNFVPANRDGAHTGDVGVEEARAGYHAQTGSSDGEGIADNGVLRTPVLNGEVLERPLDEALRKANRSLKVAGLCNELIMRANNETTLLSGICRTIVEEGGYGMALVAYLDERARKPIRIVAWNGASSRPLRALEIGISGERFASHPFHQAVYHRHPIVIHDMSATQVAPALPEAQAYGFRSLIALPLVSPTSRFGALMIYADGVGEFDGQQQADLARVADNLVFGIEMLRARHEQQRSHEEIGYLAYHDSLTGLKNRLGLLQSLEFTLSQATRHNLAAAVLFMDLDRFKFVNDTLGHEAGDDLLRLVAKRIQGAIRESDLVARQSGDEFIVLLTGRMSEGGGDGGISAEAAKVAQKIITSMKTPFIVCGREVDLTVSIGISIYPTDAGDARSLLQRADNAMYWAREKNRGCYRFYSEELSQRQMRRTAMERRLKDALVRDEFALYYQPIVELKTGRMVGAEALVRWHPGDTGEAVLPGEFIPIAEDIGLIRALGIWIIQKACGHLSRWRESNNKFCLSLNLSSRQLWYQDVVEQLIDVIAATGTSPDAIELEVTEDILLSEPDRVSRSLRTLKDHGFGVSLDDFARGYSSVSRLKRLPVSTLKIDRSFLEGIPEDKDHSDIVTATVKLAHALGKRSFAEGIESQNQWRFLKEVDCGLGQGFYFSKPVPAEVIQVMIDGGHDWQSVCPRI